MANGITPRRRRRDDDEDGDDSELSVDENGSIVSSPNKRARLQQDVNGDDTENEGSEADQPVLPDSYRRSPKGKCRATNDLPPKHQPGSIVRVKLTDFVTYTAAEFFPGPNLNMVIGPNGTGKSTLVCAICLGLGWSTNTLGRAKDVGEFVKHGASRAFIEIELAANPAKHKENPVITTKITKEGSKTEFLINGSKKSKPDVQKFAREFHIQVDNLCQFLPQDRVVEFAALSPVNLLAQTQRAAAPPYMSEWHEDLKSMRKEQKVKQDEQQSVMDHLKNMENRQRLDEVDVTSMRERSAVQARLENLEKFRPFAEYTANKLKWQDAKERRKVAEKEFKRLNRQVQPNLEASEAKKHYFERIDKVVQLRKGLLKRSVDTVKSIELKITQADERMKDVNTELETAAKTVKDSRQTKLRCAQAIQNLKRQMESQPPEVDFAGMNERVRDLTRQERELEGKLADIQDNMGQLNGQNEQRKMLIREKERQKEHLQSQVGQQANKLSRASKDTGKAWEWIQENLSKFSGDVYGPPILSCNVKQQHHAAAVEAIVGKAELLAFTVTNKPDFDKLIYQLYTTMKLTDITVRMAPSAPLESNRPPCSDQELHALGLESWLIDLLRGPDPVLAMLCDNRNIHATGYSSRDIADDEPLKRSQISSWVTNRVSCIINRRREYGPKATSIRVVPVNPARFFTDMPVDHQEEREINQAINQAKSEMQELQENITDLRSKSQDLRQQRETVSKEKKAVQNDKEEKQKQLSMFAGLPTKLEGQERTKATAEEKIRAHHQNCRAITVRGDSIVLEKCQLAIDCAMAVEALRKLNTEAIEAEILSAEARSDKEQLEAKVKHERDMLDAYEQELTQLVAKQEEYHAIGRELEVQCRAARPPDDDEEALDLVDTVTKMTPHELDTEILSNQARLEMNTGGNANLLRDFEKRAQLIEAKRARMAELESVLEDLSGKIDHTRSQWEPQLDELVGNISTAFAENFAQIQCAGEVGVYKDDDFDQWSIQIRVKFRENEPLTLLDSHRQSGGERAVSTIFYLMALQSLARAPFRVVDEINQGMDPRNERLVHSRMVSIACASTRSDGGGGGSQYFLITPKLLNNLEYHHNMKVHCIASGEHMPADHRRLDFASLAKKALAVKAAAGSA